MPIFLNILIHSLYCRKVTLFEKLKQLNRGASLFLFVYSKVILVWKCYKSTWSGIQV